MATNNLGVNIYFQTTICIRPIIEASNLAEAEEKLHELTSSLQANSNGIAYKIPEHLIGTKLYPGTDKIPDCHKGIELPD